MQTIIPSQLHILNIFKNTPHCNSQKIRTFAANILDYGQVTTDNTDAYIPPFRAYIVATGSGARPLLGTDFGDSMDIQSLQLVDRDGTEHWYDLNGRRINKPTKKGVYIHGNSKVVIK